MEAALELLGGVGLFLFGMSLMGSSLEKLAGSGLGKILETLTTSKKRGVGAIKGWLLGLVVTGIIQSSAATTIMLIGFVNAGIMRLGQSIPVVFGANVGSTVTAQILRLGDLSSGNIVLRLLKPSAFAPMLLAVGAALYIFVKKEKVKDIAGILVGLGTLFYGMTMMEGVFAPLKESKQFQEFFTSFENPLIGILTGLVITAIIQSSSASVGILQALSATGSVTFATAIPIIIGQNLGKCMTIILGGIGANKKAKRVALSYLLFNVVGAIVISVVLYTIYYTVGIPGFTKTVNRGDIANLHLGFNLIISIALLPLSNWMAALTGKILRDKDELVGDEELRTLDDMLLKTPGIALVQCKKVMDKMGEKIRENYQLAISLLENYDQKVVTKMNENESFIDRCETIMSDYVLRIDRKRLTPDNKLLMEEILNSISDYERIGDICIKIAYAAQEKSEKKVNFSEAGLMEVSVITSAAEDAIELMLESFNQDHEGMALRVGPLSEVIAELSECLKSHHVERLKEGDCGVNGGVVLYDLVNCMESIGNHSANVARHVIKRTRGDHGFDGMHGDIMDSESLEYKAMFDYYRNKYIVPVETMKIQGTKKVKAEAALQQEMAAAEAQQEMAAAEARQETVLSEVTSQILPDTADLPETASAETAAETAASVKHEKEKHKKDKAAIDKSEKEQKIKEQKAKEQKIKEQKIKEQKAKEQKAKEQKTKEQKAKEQKKNKNKKK